MCKLSKTWASTVGLGKLPKPDRIALDQPLPAEKNYRWVEVQGLIKFTGTDGGLTYLELSDGQSHAQVRALHWITEMSKRTSNAPVRVEGVCEGVYDQNDTLVAGLIWASAKDSISAVEIAATNVSAHAAVQPPLAAMTPTNPVRQGFYSTRGVVTFNDRVFGIDHIFVQEDAAAVLVTLDDRTLRSHLRVGQWVDLGGALEPGRAINRYDLLLPQCSIA